MKHPWDARACIVSLTQSGRVSEAYENVFQVIKRDIPDEDSLGVLFLLSRIRDHLNVKREMDDQ